MRRRIVGLASVCALAFSFASVSSAATAHAAPRETASVSAQMHAFAERALGHMQGAWHDSVSFAPPGTVHADADVSIDINDGTGDTTGGSDAAGDIVEAGAGADAVSSIFKLRVSTPTNPATDPNWASVDANGEPNTGALFGLDTNFDNVVDTVVVEEQIQGVVQAAIFPVDGPGGCNGSPHYDGTTISITFGGACRLPAFKWQAAMLYDDTPGNVHDDPQVDTAPNGQGLAATTPQQRAGYFMLGADGKSYGFGNGPNFTGTRPNATGFVTLADGTGLIITDGAGHVFTRGRAHYHGGSPALQPGELVTTISITPTGAGYWLFTNRGRVFPFGDAHSHGDLSGKALNGPIVASVATPDGGGYYMVGSDGGIFTFGNAKFRGSEGGKALNAPIVGIAPTPDNKGYWLVGTDGGVFTFGDAAFRGSLGGQHLNGPVDGMVAYGNGYLLVASDGGVFDFSNKAFLGSLGGKHISAPIISIVAFTVVVH